MLDALLDALGAAKTSGALPSLRRVVLAGHSSGGQIVQRYALASGLDGVTVARAAGGAGPVPVRFFPAAVGFDTDGFGAMIDRS